MYHVKYPLNTRNRSSISNGAFEVLQQAPLTYSNQALLYYTFTTRANTQVMKSSPRSAQLLFTSIHSSIHSSARSCLSPSSSVESHPVISSTPKLVLMHTRYVDAIQSIPSLLPSRSVHTSYANVKVAVMV